MKKNLKKALFITTAALIGMGTTNAAEQLPPNRLGLPKPRVIPLVNLNALLLSAVKDGNLALVGQLLDNGANPNARDAEGLTALHLAAIAQEGQTEIVDLLIARGANIHAIVNMIQPGDTHAIPVTPLLVAAQLRRTGAVTRLLQAQGDNFIVVYENEAQANYTPLGYAARHNLLNAVNTLIEQGESVNEADSDERFTPLHIATYHGNIQTINHLLLNHHANVYVETRMTLDGEDLLMTPLQMAEHRGNQDAINQLLVFGNYNRGIGGLTQLEYAVTRGHLDAANTLLRHYPNQVNVVINREAPMALIHMAAARGNVPMLAMLLQRGADIDMQILRDGNRTALHYALEHNQLEVFRLLLERGANPNLADSDGVTPLHLAVTRPTGQNPYEMRDLAYLQALIGIEGINVNARNREGETPLHIAAREGDLEAVRILLQRPRIEVNPVTEAGELTIGGETPLHDAARGGYREIVLELLNAGANPSLENIFGETPVTLAEEAAEEDADQEEQQLFQTIANEIRAFDAKGGYTVVDATGMPLWGSDDATFNLATAKYWAAQLAAFYILHQMGLVSHLNPGSIAGK